MRRLRRRPEHNPNRHRPTRPSRGRLSQRCRCSRSGTDPLPNVVRVPFAEEPARRAFEGPTVLEVSDPGRSKDGRFLLDVECGGDGAIRTNRLDRKFGVRSGEPVPLPQDPAQALVLEIDLAEAWRELGRDEGFLKADENAVGVPKASKTEHGAPRPDPQVV